MRPREVVEIVPEPCSYAMLRSNDSVLVNIQVGHVRSVEAS